ncbi:DNA-binding transcriptional MerR regulator [Mobilisporobacter senegalensis]|uniref:DNA-binding transcriptional MerR regulator n=1 Tax=Mobilisporobacter senegalensis TaxID=1329262 RepID=A0A3N1XPY5_9FIRM|nr:MerR family transcriptional regulator [Mobilisporobacter senegalensis]ROR28740.1 DNA-binding transcriptional MerR regulator [Mobilisporobacter senegalensis]
MLKIGDFSKLSRISIRMLRHYDEIGLLVPEEIDHFTNYRYYSENQLPLASRIKALKDMGFSLASVFEILKNYDNPKALEQYLMLKQTEIREQVKESNQRLLLLETTINRLRKEDSSMNYDVILKELPERYVASVRKTIDSYDKEGMLWNILMTETAPLHIQADNPCYTLAIFHDGEYKERDVDVEVQKSVKGDYKNTDNVVFKTVPPILMASATYKGSYDQVTEVNQAVANWILDNGYEFDGVNFCIYHVSPHETSNPEELVTEVCYPVKKK